MNTPPSPTPRPLPQSLRRLTAAEQQRLLAMTPAELLDEALRLAQGLSATVAEVFGQSPEPVDLSKLTLQEKLELGERNCRSLREIAMKLAPEKTLDAMEADLATDPGSKAATQALLQRVQPVGRA